MAVNSQAQNAGKSVKRKQVEEDYSAFNRDEARAIRHAYERSRQIGGEFGGGLDPRRRQEVADAGMIREDHTQMANLPRQAQHHEFEQNGYAMNPYIDALRLDGVRDTEQLFRMDKYLSNEKD